MTTAYKTPKGEISIRIATSEDAQALFELRLEALSAHPEAFAADVESTRARGVQDWVDQITRDANDQTGIIVIAKAGNELIGMSGVGRGHWPKTRHTAIVWGVYVQPAWRGQHIAQAILDECIHWSAEHRIVVLKLGVLTSNKAAIRCYERAGFTTHGIEPKSIFFDGVYYDEYLMSRMV